MPISQVTCKGRMIQSVEREVTLTGCPPACAHSREIRNVAFSHNVQIQHKIEGLQHNTPEDLAPALGFEESFSKAIAMDSAQRDDQASVFSQLQRILPLVQFSSSYSSDITSSHGNRK